MSAPWTQFAIDSAAWFAANPTVAAFVGETAPTGPLPLPASPTLAQVTAAYGATTMTARFDSSGLPLAVIAVVLSQSTYWSGLPSSRGLDNVEVWLHKYEVATVPPAPPFTGVPGAPFSSR